MLVKNVILLVSLAFVLSALPDKARAATPPETSPDKYPYHAYIQGHGTYWCSGTLISKDYVVTNAFCVNGSTGVTVYLGFKGNPYYEANRQEPNTFTIDSSEVIVHEDFTKIRENRYLNNIALVRLATPAIFTQTIQPGLLSTKQRNQLLSGKVGDLSSWYKETLSHSRMRFSSQDTCRVAFGADYFNDQELCGRWLDGVLEATGIPVILDGKIVGERTSAPCPTSGFVCGDYVVIINFAQFLNWISRNTNISITQLTGDPNADTDCCQRVERLQYEIIRRLDNLSNVVDTVEVRQERVEKYLQRLLPLVYFNGTSFE